MPGATFLISPGSGAVPPEGAGKDRLNRAWLAPSLGGGMVSLLPADCPPCDIAPAEALRPVDQVDGAIGARPRLLDGGRHGAHVQHPPTIGQHAFAVGFRAGMEDLHALDL